VSAVCLLLICTNDNSEANDPEAKRQFGWVPQAMLHCVIRTDAPVELRFVFSRHM
jgi:hypothetical protein